MIKLKIKNISQSLPTVIKTQRPQKKDVKQFQSNLKKYFSSIDSKETEENLKTHFMEFLKPLFNPNYMIEQQGDIDFVIRTGGKGSKATVLFEVKRESNKTDMIRKTDVNRKAFHEILLYFMRERYAGNTDIQYLIICTEYEIYVFEASIFERNFFRNINFKNDFDLWQKGKKSDVTTDFFYKQIASPFIQKSDFEIEAAHVNLRDFEGKLDSETYSKHFIDLFKILSPDFLVKRELLNDSNSLNKVFYEELLHIVGLEERKEGSKRIIGRLKEGKRNPASLLENAIDQIRYENDFNSEAMILTYGNSNADREFNIALELCLTWVNRLLFLKLLEAQIYKFNSGDESFKFLSTSKISDFDDLSDLFFKVLAFHEDERPNSVKEKFNKVPYLNSSLFERTKLEEKFRINSLNNGLEIKFFNKTILKDRNGNRLVGQKATLGYIFDFLDAYDFGAVGVSNVVEESKTIINAAVLGLIFEKINGYRDGAIFTPSLITMYMANRSIEQLTLEKFKQENPSWILKDIDDLKNNITDRSKDSILKMNEIINELKICDPAVGSGHFLVSCLNEIISLKSKLGILADSEGNRISEYSVFVENDELAIVHSNTDEVFSYKIIGEKAPTALQHVQKTLFHEKQNLIENCLFGVDININSVRICQLRLWIELLKNAYYQDNGCLETLPNIDINIKCGNALLSRFTLDQNLSEAFKSADLTVTEYRQLVSDYKTTKDKSKKRSLQEGISRAKTLFQAEQLNQVTKKIDAEIASEKAQEAQEDLFLEDNNQKTNQANKIKKIRERIKKLEKSREKLIQNKTFMGAFEWRFEFPEVLDDKGKFIGFDLIIANPPYGVSIKEPVRSHITKSLGKVPDYEIYYLFINLAYSVLKSEGTTCQIVPNSLLFNHFAKIYREKLLHDWKSIHIDDLTNYDVFDGVVVRNIIYQGRRRLGYDGVRFRRTGDSPSVKDYLIRETDFASAETLIVNNRNWGLVFRLSAETMEVVSTIRNAGSVLEDKFPEISQGLIAYDKYQGQSKNTIKNRIYHSNQKSEKNSPWLKGEDVTRFKVEWNGSEYIEYSDKLANKRRPDFFVRPRILVREITNPRIYAALENDEFYNDPAIINILVDSNVEFEPLLLLAILNSKLASFYHFNSSPKATKGAFPKILVEDIRSFPLPHLSHQNSILLENLMKRTVKICELSKTNASSKECNRLDLENESDVYDLYGLDEKDKAIIEGYFDNKQDVALNTPVL